MKTADSDFTFNCNFFRRFWLILGIMFPKFFSMTVLLALAILLMCGLDQFLTYQMGILPSEFYQVLGHRDLIGFKMISLRSVGLIIGKATVLTSISYGIGVLYICWRGMITAKFHELYFEPFIFYDLNYMNSLNVDVDNPDQRISQDVEKTCRVFSEIFSKVIMSPFIIAYYTYKTWESSGYLGPVSIYAYFAVATVFNKFLMSPVIKRVTKQERQEGNFRFKHVSVRSHCEAIAFYHAASLEKLFTDGDLERLLAVQQNLVNWRFLLQYVTNLFDYFGAILSYWIISIPILAEGKYDDLDPVAITGMISRNSFYYMYLINSFSSLIDISTKVTDMAGTAHRIGFMFEILVRMHASNQSQRRLVDRLAYENALFPSKRASEGDPDADWLSVLSEKLRSVSFISLTSVSICIPETDVCLIRDLTFDIVQGKHMLITGDSGSGKSSLLRVLCGFWNASEGTITWRVPNRLPCVLYLPQKTYFPSATLRQQLLYPYRSAYTPRSDKEDARLMDLLRSLDLEHLFNRCGGLDAESSWDWNHILTPGEAQRLSVLRALYHKPLLVIMDEVTSAVGEDYESQIYGMLKAAEITMVSVGHRDSLRAHHDIELHITKGTGYSITQLK